MQYSESPQGFGSPSVISNNSTNHEKGQHIGPQGLMVFHDYDEGLKHAKNVGKPLMLDFTGHACVNCRKMEEQVWTDLRVKNILSKEVVLVSLYVDERIVLPEDEQYLSEVSGKEIKRVGQKWSDFQATNYNANAQPFYVIIDPNGSFEPLNGSAAYHPDASVFVDWLQEGIDRFKLL